jgi:hypothetical protein
MANGKEISPAVAVIVVILVVALIVGFYMYRSNSAPQAPAGGPMPAAPGAPAGAPAPGAIPAPGGTAAPAPAAPSPGG